MPTGHRTILSLPVPILQTRRRPMRCTSTTRPRCPGENSSRRVRLRPTLEAASQTRSELWTTITTRLWLFELENLRSIHADARVYPSTVWPLVRHAQPVDDASLFPCEPLQRPARMFGIKKPGLVRHEAHEDPLSRSFARSNKMEKASLSGRSLYVASSRGCTGGIRGRIGIRHCRKTGKVRQCRVRRRT